ncbi:MAG: sugar transferase [Terracidiphilus sp.]|nr:sugar transferase [Terracidiphilus sp.]
MIHILTALNRDWYRAWGKRALDIVGTCFALLLLWPIGLLIAAVVRVLIGIPILFVQPRPGLNARTFQLQKFRTMTEARGADGELLSDALRVTAVGRFLRSSSLDELPELLNILRGDMSLVGPRPLLVEYLPYYSKEQGRRHNVRPGLTGLAQITGRNETSWEHRLVQDVYYVDNLTFLLDCKILLQTVVAVARGDGGTAAIEKLGKFRGSVRSCDNRR